MTEIIVIPDSVAPLVTTERMAEIAKKALRWTPHAPHYTPQLYEVMDAMALLMKEAEAEMKRRNHG